MDGEFLKWGLTLGSMVIHILQEHSQVTHFLNPPGQPFSMLCRPQLSGNRLQSFLHEAPPPSSQPVEETEARSGKSACQSEI